MTNVFKPFSNGTKSTRRIKSDKVIVITDADKGSAAVIVDVKDYLKERHQSN